jgi:hypothetical protein
MITCLKSPPCRPLLRLPTCLPLPAFCLCWLLSGHSEPAFLFSCGESCSFAGSVGLKSLGLMPRGFEPCCKGAFRGWPGKPGGGLLTLALTASSGSFGCSAFSANAFPGSFLLALAGLRWFFTRALLRLAAWARGLAQVLTSAVKLPASLACWGPAGTRASCMVEKKGRVRARPQRSLLVSADRPLRLPLPAPLLLLLVRLSCITASSFVFALGPGTGCLFRPPVFCCRLAPCRWPLLLVFLGVLGGFLGFGRSVPFHCLPFRFLPSSVDFWFT